MPSREEIIKALEDAQSTINLLMFSSRMNKSPSQTFIELAAQVGNMCCENCSRLFIVTGGDGEGTPCQWSGSGGCWHFEEKEK